MAQKAGQASLDEISTQLQKTLKTKRYAHTTGVMYTAASLAMAYGESIEDALYAGLLHDCAKYLTDQEMLKTAKQYKLRVTRAESDAPYLLHAKIGAVFAEEKYGVTSKKIKRAIRYHTTGRENMTMLEKIVFVADYIEPGRNKADHLTEIRKAAFSDIDLAVWMILRDTLDYLEIADINIDKTTAKAYHFYNDLIKSRK